MKNSIKIISNYNILLIAMIVAGAIFLIVIKKENKTTSRYSKVIQYYSQNKSDSLKLKAAHFLLDNMNEFISYKTNTSDFYNAFSFRVGMLSDSLANLSHKDRNQIINNSLYEKITFIWDSLQQTYGFSATMVEKQPDLNNLTPEILIDNIELAFDVWQLPWAEDLSFDEFCEFVLPYRGFGEPVDNWRQDYFEKNLWIIDSMKGSKDRVKACTLINDNLESWFLANRFFMYNFPGGQGGKMLLESKIGKCVDQVNLAIYSMRSMGIPVTMDFAPLYGNWKSGHTWNALLLENGKTVNFQGASHNGIYQQAFPFKLSKVYRKTFAENKNCLANKISDYKNIPPILRSKHFIDVSGDYSNVFTSKDIELLVFSINNKDAKFVYLCTFNNSNWEAITWSEINNERVTFKNVGVDIVYLLAYYNNGEYTPANSPFILTKNGEIQFLSPSEKTQKLRLERKFPFSDLMKRRSEFLKKGRFQGADRPDFINANTLYEINESEEIKPFYVVKGIENKKKYRYVRFIPYERTEIAEISFFSLNKDTKRQEILTGNIISSLRKSKEKVFNMFDNKTENYFSYPKEANIWFGLDLGQPKLISQIAYCPRNDSNNIEPDNLYELFYWDNEWKSLGKKKSDGYELIYRNAPQNALFWLRNLTKGKEERIFTYENDLQIWW